MLPNLARLYWYTVEFGLMQDTEGLRIYGAGIVSSATESVFAIEDPSPNRLGFDLERVMRPSTGSTTSSRSISSSTASRP
jgi:phenylalanine-4-hydroxylase